MNASHEKTYEFVRKALALVHDQDGEDADTLVSSAVLSAVVDHLSLVMGGECLADMLRDIAARKIGDAFVERVARGESRAPNVITLPNVRRRG